MRSEAMAGVACASITMQLSSPTMTPEFGSPSAVNAYRPGPIWSNETFFSVISLVDAKPLVMETPVARSRRVTYHVLLDGAENRTAGGIQHLDAHAVAELQERRHRLACVDGLDGAFFRDAGIAEAALRDRLARPAIGVAVRHRAGAKDRAGRERAGLRRVRDQGREIEG